MLIASKSGQIDAAKLISETDTHWTVRVERHEYQLSKNDPARRAFSLMSDALKWGRADSEMIEHFLNEEAAQAAEKAAQ